MSDDKAAEAAKIVADFVIAAALREDYPIAPEWENYPDVGEYDWGQIAQRVATVRDTYEPDAEAYEAALNFLEARADAE